MKSALKIFKALADLNRLRIVKILSTKSLCVCEITEILGLAVSTVSSHLKILREAELIEETKDGKWINYRLTTPPLPLQQQILASISNLDDAVLQTDRQKALTTDRNRISGNSSKK